MTTGSLWHGKPDKKDTTFKLLKLQNLVLFMDYEDRNSDKQQQ
jgi:hypothetical protein